MNSVYWIIGQIFTVISYIIFWISRFKKNKNKLLLLDNISRFFAIVSFIFLGTYDGIKNTLYVVLRNTLGQITNNKKTKWKLVTLFFLLIILALMYCFNYNDISTIFIAICGILNLYGVIMCGEQGIRIFGMIGSLFYTGFMFATGNIMGTICEIICFIVMIISFLKYKDSSNIDVNN